MREDTCYFCHHPLGPTYTLHWGNRCHVECVPADVKDRHIAALEAENARLKQLLGDAKQALTNEQVAHGNTIRQRTEASAAVKVKPLDWKDGRNCECSAETVVGLYEVGFDDGWWAQLEGGATWDWEPDRDPRSYEGPDAAKAAAQADYERRILSALQAAGVKR